MIPGIINKILFKKIKMIQNKIIILHITKKFIPKIKMIFKIKMKECNHQLSH